MATRTPLMAGNWKMNLDHQQATHLVQKLAWTLEDAKHDYEAVEVAVLPPFTDIRSVQTLIDGDKLRAPVRRPGPLGARLRRLHRRDLRRVPRQARLHLRGRRAQRAAPVPPRGRRARRRQGEGGAPARAGPDPVRRREPGRPRGRLQVQHSSTQVTAALDGVRRQTAETSWWPTSRSGRSAPVRWRPRRTPRRCARRSAAALAELYGPAVADGVRVLYGGSVKAANIAAIMAQPDVDGALVGGASIDAAEFAAVVRYRQHVTT